MRPMRPMRPPSPYSLPPVERCSAWLLIRYRDRGPNTHPELIDVRIYSEPTPTNRVGEFYACLLEMSGDTYLDAHNAIVERCGLWPWLRWTLMFVKPERQRR